MGSNNFNLIILTKAFFTNQFTKSGINTYFFLMALCVHTHTKCSVQRWLYAKKKKTKALIPGSWWTTPLGNIMTATYTHTAFTAKPKPHTRFLQTYFSSNGSFISRNRTTLKGGIKACISQKTYFSDVTA